jgi:uncharacterized membrane protein YhhN
MTFPRVSWSAVANARASWTAKERRFIRNWAWAVLAFYGSAGLIVVILASLAGHAERAINVVHTDYLRTLDLESAR